MDETPWYIEAFRADYRTVYAHRDPQAARREVDWILSLGLSGRILDLCCGFGRHSAALAAAGHDVVGLDLSEELLALSSELVGRDALRGRLLRGDARRLPFRAAAFDGVVNLFSSFGYFGEAGDADVAREVARVLRPGGIALFDLMNPPRVRAGLVPRSESKRSGISVVEERSLQDDGKRVTKRVELEFDDGRKRSWCERVRMYEPDEIDSLLDGVGLEVEARHGDFAGAPHDESSERQIVVARR